MGAEMQSVHPLSGCTPWGRAYLVYLEERTSFSFHKDSLAYPALGIWDCLMQEWNLLSLPPLETEVSLI